MKPDNECAATRSEEPGNEERLSTNPHLRRLSYACIGLLVLAILAVLRVGRSLLLPLAVALLLSFVLRPIARRLAHWHLPFPVSAFLLVAVISGVIGYGIYSLGEPARQWLEEAPGSLRELQYRIEALKLPVEKVQEATEQMEKLGQVGRQDSQTVVIQEEGLDDQLLIETRQATAGILTTLLILFFLLGWGDRMYRNLVSILPHFRNQRQVVLIAQEIQSAIATYLGTITLINLGLGAAVTLMLYLMDMPNPVLWGVMTALLNYVPYLGPALTAVVLTLIALLSYPSFSEALLVPLLFLAMTSVEGYIITPLTVGSRLTLNPLLILLSLLFWFWMWGMVGALLTVPILVCIKVTMDRLQSAKPFARLLD